MWYLQCVLFFGYRVASVGRESSIGQSYVIFFISPGGHPFSTHEKFSEKLTF